MSCIKVCMVDFMLFGWIWLTRTSPVSVQGLGYDWRRCLPGQCRFVSHHLDSSSCSVLSLSVYVQGVLHAPNGVTLRARIDSIIRHDPNQHIAIRAREHRSVVDARSLYSILDRCHSRRIVHSGHIPPSLVDADIHHRADDSYLDFPCLSDAHHWPARWDPR